MATRAILVDRRAMRCHFPHFERYGACVLRGCDHSGEVASNIANDLFEAAQDGSDWADRLVDCLCQFLGYAMPRDNPPEAADVWLCAAMAFARDRLGDTDLRAGDLAAVAGVSIRHLYALFAATGQTPKRWLMDERLAAAARDLSDPESISLRISDIAEAQGFRDSAHLSTAFRRRFGVSPRAYRSRTGAETPPQRTPGQADSRNSQDFRTDDP
ncbi:AraC family transcriptional regulator [uncultured Maritimibacter sp.]|jgi:AraC-like DNA-binding protein|uniref:AraC family transcriptional regulator n=1 Tax=uncultured Maritimibacter sp. TaxID=991866 RepID=UPI000A893030|nr:AraC family transcriptional regulator [uncultured Maritimibacter sp.]